MANGYGAANFGVNIYGQASYVDASVAISSVSALLAIGSRIAQASTVIADTSVLAANGQVLVNASAVFSDSSALVAAGIRISDAAIEIDAVSTLTAAGVMAISASASISEESSVVANGSAIMAGFCVISAVSGMTATGRYKYEPIPVDPQVWNPSPSDSATWTNL